jgi:hypothetical protein
MSEQDAASDCIMSEQDAASDWEWSMEDGVLVGERGGWRYEDGVLVGQRGDQYADARGDSGPTPQDHEEARIPPKLLEQVRKANDEFFAAAHMRREGTQATQAVKEGNTESTDPKPASSTEPKAAKLQKLTPEAQYTNRHWIESIFGPLGPLFESTVG